MGRTRLPKDPLELTGWMFSTVILTWLSYIPLLRSNSPWLHSKSTEALPHTKVEVHGILPAACMLPWTRGSLCDYPGLAWCPGLLCRPVRKSNDRRTALWPWIWHPGAPASTGKTGLDSGSLCAVKMKSEIMHLVNQREAEEEEIFSYRVLSGNFKWFTSVCKPAILESPHVGRNRGKNRRKEKLMSLLDFQWSLSLWLAA